MKMFIGMILGVLLVFVAFKAAVLMFWYTLFAVIVLGVSTVGYLSFRLRKK